MKCFRRKKKKKKKKEKQNRMAVLLRNATLNLFSTRLLVASNKGNPYDSNRNSHRFQFFFPFGLYISLKMVMERDPSKQGKHSHCRICSL